MSKREISYSTDLGAIKRHQRQVDYPTIVQAERTLPPHPRLPAVDVHRLLTPYVSVRLVAQLRASTWRPI